MPLNSLSDLEEVKCVYCGGRRTALSQGTSGFKLMLARIVSSAYLLLVSEDATPASGSTKHLDAENFSRSADLEFVSLQGGNTAALTFNHVPVKMDFAQDAKAFLSENRSAFQVINLVWLWSRRSRWQRLKPICQSAPF